MSISTAARGDTLINVIDPVSAANTAAATSGWIDMRGYKGDIIFIQTTGALTGSLASKIQGATSSGGAGAADITGAAFTAVSAANKVHRCVVPATAAPYMKYVGTVTTGPIVICVIAMASPVGDSA
jgi:hypothetical protein